MNKRTTLSHRTRSHDFKVDLASMVLGTLAAFVVVGAIDPDGLGRTDSILLGLVTLALVHGKSISFEASLSGISSRTFLVWIAVALPLGLFQIAAAVYGVLALML